MAIKILVEPDNEPVTLAEAKVWMRVDQSIEDSLINGLIRTARMHIEAIIGRAMITQTIQQTSTAQTNTGIIDLLIAPVQSVLIVAKINADGSENILAVSDYQVDIDNNRIAVGIIETGSAFRLEYIAGYGALASSVPEALRTAILSQTARLFEHRDGEAVGISHSVQSLLSPFARVRL